MVSVRLRYRMELDQDHATVLPLTRPIFRPPPPTTPCFYKAPHRGSSATSSLWGRQKILGSKLFTPPAILGSKLFGTSFKNLLKFDAMPTDHPHMEIRRYTYIPPDSKADKITTSQKSCGVLTPHPRRR